MSINDEGNSSGGNTLGEAANRYVTFQIVSAIIGGIVFLILLFAVFLPMFNRTNQSLSNSAPMAGTSTMTIDGRPASPEEQRAFEQQIKNAPPHGASSQPPMNAPK